MGTDRSTPSQPSAWNRARSLLARTSAIAALGLALAGCERSPASAAGTSAVAPSTSQAQSGAPPATAGTAQPAGNVAANPAPPAPGRSDPNCTAPLDAPGAKLLQLRPARGQLVLGVLAGLKDASDDNLLHLRNLVAELRKRGAEVLVVDGDLGDNSDAQEDLLAAVGSVEPQIPILVGAGNREVRADLDAAEASLRKRGLQLIDFSHTRVVDLGDALLVGLPGVFERRLLRADGACLYALSDLDALASYFDKLPQSAPPAMLVAAVPPHGENGLALDFTDGQNVGEMRFIPLLTSTRARFGLFGQVWEAGGRAVDGQGRAVPAGQLSNQLYVNPGAADRTPWPMNDGSTSRGLAALIIIRGRQASFELVREPPAPPRSP